jgi:hypothetical protein
MKIFVLTATAFLSLIPLSACNRVQTHFDCLQVCQRYSDCFDKSYDVGACKDRCEAMPGTADQRQEIADDCEDCLDNQSCISGQFACGNACQTIVP